MGRLIQRLKPVGTGPNSGTSAKTMSSANTARNTSGIAMPRPANAHSVVPVSAGTRGARSSIKCESHSRLAGQGSGGGDWFAAADRVRVLRDCSSKPLVLARRRLVAYPLLNVCSRVTPWTASAALRWTRKAARGCFHPRAACQEGAPVSSRRPGAGQWPGRDFLTREYATLVSTMVSASVRAHPRRACSR
jgi:hypothetical protein